MKKISFIWVGSIDHPQKECVLEGGCVLYTRGTIVVDISQE